MKSIGVDPPPGWFQRALDQTPDHFTVDVDGCEIHCRAWGDNQLPVLLLVHGGGAHSGWWDHVAPFLADSHRVLAPDLSGHGDSQPRPNYDLSTWAREVLAVSAHETPSSRPVIVGHSMGGWVAATAALQDAARVDGIVVIDSPLRERAPEGRRLRERRGRPEGYRTRGEIVSRFHAVPRQDVTLPYVARHIAIESIRRKGLRWFWKFDPAIFHGQWMDDPFFEQGALDNIIDEMRCRISYVRCEHGLVSGEMANRIRDMLELRGPFIDLPDAGHHPMLDHPLALVTALRTLVEVWSIT